MTNFIGKLLVQIHVGLSVVAFGFALSMYFDLVDWGWKSPRKVVDTVLASELDKRLAHQKEGLRRRNNAYPPVKTVWATVREGEKYFVENNLWYPKELTRLASDANKIEVKELRYFKGSLMLDTQIKPHGKPLYQEKPIPELAKSRDAYDAELKKLNEDARIYEEKFRELQKKQEERSRAMIGEIKDGKKRPGLIDLRRVEIETQEQIIKEIRYLEPREVELRTKTEGFRERRQLLEEDLARREKGFKKLP